jgi:hypothetical protein
LSLGHATAVAVRLLAALVLLWLLPVPAPQVAWLTSAAAATKTAAVAPKIVRYLFI